MILQQSHIGEKMRNKMNIDMIMYDLYYSPPVTLYRFIITDTHRKENEKQNEY